MGREARRRYGKLSGYAEEEVLPALQVRGLYEIGEDRILGIFPWEKWRVTEAGARARQELESTTREAEENFPEWACGDPERARSFMGMAGPAMLMMPARYPQVAGLSGSGGYSDNEDEEEDVGGAGGAALGSGGAGSASMGGTPGDEEGSEPAGEGAGERPGDQDPGALDPSGFEGLPGLSDSLGAGLSGGFFKDFFGDPGGGSGEGSGEGGSFGDSGGGFGDGGGGGGG